jgi:hypothetical protein
LGQRALLLKHSLSLARTPTTLKSPSGVRGEFSSILDRSAGLFVGARRFGRRSLGKVEAVTIEYWEG